MEKNHIEIIEYSCIEEPTSNNERIDISGSGFWMVNSYKSNNGVEELRNPDNSIFWQSDGKYPHFIEINFNSAIKLSEIWIYLDYTKDESYCPKKIEFKLMNILSQMMSFKTVLIENGQGWYKIEVKEVDNNSKEIVK
jgi:anaphase-promoting complex subunit 10